VGRKPVDIGRGSWLFGRYRSRVVLLSRLLSTPCSESSGLYPFILLRNILLLTIKSGRCAAKHCLGSASKYSKRSDARKKRNTAGQGSRGNRKPPRCQQGMTPATGFPCPRLPSPGDRRHPIDHSVPFEDPKRVTKEGV
jgi:hypothetical protein